MRLPRRRAPCWVRWAAGAAGGTCIGAVGCVPVPSDRRTCAKPRVLQRAHPPTVFPCTGLSLPQAQVLGELFGGREALLDPPRPATLKNLVAFLACWDRHPHLFDQICQVREGGGWVGIGRGTACGRSASQREGAAPAWMPRSAAACSQFPLTPPAPCALSSSGVERRLPGGGAAAPRRGPLRRLLLPRLHGRTRGPRALQARARQVRLCACLCCTAGQAQRGLVRPAPAPGLDWCWRLPCSTLARCS